jgi:hypothetical protein
MILHEQIDHGDGTLSLRYRTVDSIEVAGPRLFARMRVLLTGY